MPSSRTSSLRTSRKPLGYLPSGAADRTQTHVRPSADEAADAHDSVSRTGLETRLQHVGRNRHGPVEDPCHPAGKQNAGNAELRRTGCKDKFITHRAGAYESSTKLTGQMDRCSAYLNINKRRSCDPTDLLPSGVSEYFSHSYVMKYIPLAGTSETE